MKIITTYEANDGTMFDTEDACRKYEQGKMNYYSHFFNADFEPVFFTEKSPPNEDDIVYIVFDDADTLNDMRSFCESEYGFDIQRSLLFNSDGTPRSLPAVVTYDWDSNEWVNIDVECVKAKTKVETCTKILSEILSRFMQ